MKNFNKKLTLVVALASMISSASAGILPQRGVLFMGRSFLGSFKDGVFGACDAVQYNVRDAFGFVTPMEQLQREAGNLTADLKSGAMDAAIDATTGLVRDFMPVSLRKKITTEQTQKLVIVAGYLSIIGVAAAGVAIQTKASQAGTAMKNGMNNAGTAMKNGAKKVGSKLYDFAHPAEAKARAEAEAKARAEEMIRNMPSPFMTSFAGMYRRFVK